MKYWTFPIARAIVSGLRRSSRTNVDSGVELSRMGSAVRSNAPPLTSNLDGERFNGSHDARAIADATQNAKIQKIVDAEMQRIQDKPLLPPESFRFPYSNIFSSGAASYNFLPSEGVASILSENLSSVNEEASEEKVDEAFDVSKLEIIVPEGLAVMLKKIPDYIKTHGSGNSEDAAKASASLETLLTKAGDSTSTPLQVLGSALHVASDASNLSKVSEGQDKVVPLSVAVVGSNVACAINNTLTPEVQRNIQEAVEPAQKFLDAVAESAKILLIEDVKAVIAQNEELTNAVPAADTSAVVLSTETPSSERREGMVDVPVVDAVQPMPPAASIPAATDLATTRQKALLEAAQKLGDLGAENRIRGDVVSGVVSPDTAQPAAAVATTVPTATVPAVEAANVAAEATQPSMIKLKNISLKVGVNNDGKAKYKDYTIFHDEENQMFFSAPGKSFDHSGQKINNSQSATVINREKFDEIEKKTELKVSDYENALKAFNLSKKERKDAEREPEEPNYKAIFGEVIRAQEAVVSNAPMDAVMADALPVDVAETVVLGDDQTPVPTVETAQPATEAAQPSTIKLKNISLEVGVGEDGKAKYKDYTVFHDEDKQKFFYAPGKIGTDLELAKLRNKTEITPSDYQQASDVFNKSQKERKDEDSPYRTIFGDVIRVQEAIASNAPVDAIMADVAEVSPAEEVSERTITASGGDSIAPRGDEVVPTSELVAGAAAAENVLDARKILGLDEDALLNTTSIGNAFRKQVKLEGLSPNREADVKRLNVLVNAKDVLMEAVKSPTLDSETISPEEPTVPLRIADGDKESELAPAASEAAQPSTIKLKNISLEVGVGEDGKAKYKDYTVFHDEENQMFFSAPGKSFDHSGQKINNSQSATVINREKFDEIEKKTELKVSDYENALNAFNLSKRVRKDAEREPHKPNYKAIFGEAIRAEGKADIKEVTPVAPNVLEKASEATNAAVKPVRPPKPPPPPPPRDNAAGDSPTTVTASPSPPPSPPPPFSRQEDRGKVQAEGAPQGSVRQQAKETQAKADVFAATKKSSPSSSNKTWGTPGSSIGSATKAATPASSSRDKSSVAAKHSSARDTEAEIRDREVKAAAIADSTQFLAELEQLNTSFSDAKVSLQKAIDVAQKEPSDESIQKANTAFVVVEQAHTKCSSTAQLIRDLKSKIETLQSVNVRSKPASFVGENTRMNAIISSLDAQLQSLETNVRRLSDPTAAMSAEALQMLDNMKKSFSKLNDGDTTTVLAAQEVGSLIKPWDWKFDTTLKPSIDSSVKKSSDHRPPPPPPPPPPRSAGADAVQTASVAKAEPEVTAAVVEKTAAQSASSSGAAKGGNRKQMRAAGQAQAQNRRKRAAEERQKRAAVEAGSLAKAVVDQAVPVAQYISKDKGVVAIVKQYKELLEAAIINGDSTQAHTLMNDMSNLLNSSKAENSPNFKIQEDLAKSVSDAAKKNAQINNLNVLAEAGGMLDSAVKDEHEEEIEEKIELDDEYDDDDFEEAVEEVPAADEVYADDFEDEDDKAEAAIQPPSSTGTVAAATPVSSPEPGIPPATTTQQAAGPSTAADSFREVNEGAALVTPPTGPLFSHASTAQPNTDAAAADVATQSVVPPVSSPVSTSSTRSSQPPAAAVAAHQAASTGVTPVPQSGTTPASKREILMPTNEKSNDTSPASTGTTPVPQSGTTTAAGAGQPAATKADADAVNILAAAASASADEAAEAAAARRASPPPPRDSNSNERDNDSGRHTAASSRSSSAASLSAKAGTSASGINHPDTQATPEVRFDSTPAARPGAPVGAAKTGGTPVSSSSATPPPAASAPAATLGSSTSSHVVPTTPAAPARAAAASGSSSAVSSSAAAPAAPRSAAPSAATTPVATISPTSGIKHSETQDTPASSSSAGAPAAADQTDIDVFASDKYLKTTTTQYREITQDLKNMLVGLGRETGVASQEERSQFYNGADYVVEVPSSIYPLMRNAFKDIYTGSNEIGQAQNKAQVAFNIGELGRTNALTTPEGRADTYESMFDEASTLIKNIEKSNRYVALDKPATKKGVLSKIEDYKQEFKAAQGYAAKNEILLQAGDLYQAYKTAKSDTDYTKLYAIIVPSRTPAAAASPMTGTSPAAASSTATAPPAAPATGAPFVPAGTAAAATPPTENQEKIKDIEGRLAQLAANAEVQARKAKDAFTMAKEVNGRMEAKIKETEAILEAAVGKYNEASPNDKQEALQELEEVLNLTKINKFSRGLNMAIENIKGNSQIALDAAASTGPIVQSFTEALAEYKGIGGVDPAKAAEFSNTLEQMKNFQVNFERSAKAEMQELPAKAEYFKTWVVTSLNEMQQGLERERELSAAVTPAAVDEDYELTAGFFDNVPNTAAATGSAAPFPSFANFGEVDEEDEVDDGFDPSADEDVLAAKQTFEKEKVLPVLAKFYNAMKPEDPKSKELCAAVKEIIDIMDPEHNSISSTASPTSVTESPGVAVVDDEPAMTSEEHLELLKELETKLADLLADGNKAQMSDPVATGLEKLQGLVTQSINVVNQQIITQTTKEELAAGREKQSKAAPSDAPSDAPDVDPDGPGAFNN
jgi:hypothetical protein